MTKMIKITDKAYNETKKIVFRVNRIGTGSDVSVTFGSKVGGVGQYCVSLYAQPTHNCQVFVAGSAHYMAQLRGNDAMLARFLVLMIFHVGGRSIGIFDIKSHRIDDFVATIKPWTSALEITPYTSTNTSEMNIVRAHFNIEMIATAREALHKLGLFRMNEYIFNTSMPFQQLQPLAPGHSYQTTKEKEEGVELGHKYQIRHTLMAETHQEREKEVEKRWVVKKAQIEAQRAANAIRRKEMGM